MSVQKPLTRGQKIFAYTSLAVVLAWTLLGVFAIWVLLTDPNG